MIDHDGAGLDAREDKLLTGSVMTGLIRPFSTLSASWYRSSKTVSNKSVRRAHTWTPGEPRSCCARSFARPSANFLRDSIMTRRKCGPDGMGVAGDSS